MKNQIVIKKSQKKHLKTKNKRRKRNMENIERKVIRKKK